MLLIDVGLEDLSTDDFTGNSWRIIGERSRKEFTSGRGNNRIKRLWGDSLGTT